MNLQMNTADFIKRGLKSINKDLPDDYFIVGDIENERTNFIMANVGEYVAHNLITFHFSQDKICSSFKRIADNYQEFRVESKESIIIDEPIMQWFANIEKLSLSKLLTITIDLTSLDREFITVLMYVLRNLSNSPSIRLLYVSAEKYIENDWEMLDYHKPQECPVVPGIAQFGLPSLMILLTGFEVRGVKNLIKYYEPDRIMAGYTKKGEETTKDASERNYKDLKQIMTTYKDDDKIGIDEFGINSRDPVKCYYDILQALKDNNINISNFNTKIVAMNNRLANIGAYLLVEKFPDIQMLYIKPADVILDSLSSGIGHYYEFILPIKERNYENN